MRASEALKIFNDIAATSSRNEKEEILGRFIGDQMIKDVLTLAYDPFVTFGITPPRVETEGRDDFDGHSPIWAMLHGLSSRSITGGEAHELVKEWLLRLNPSASELLWRILSKDLRCGISISTINKVLPGTVPVFDVMLAHKFEEKRIKVWPAITEPKLDGVRVICLVRDGKAQFFSRSGKPFPAVDHLGPKIVKMLKATKGAPNSDHSYNFIDQMVGKKADSIALDGEITTGNFNKSSGDVRRKSETASDAVYSIFDAVPLEILTGDAKSFDVPYKDRRSFVHWLVGLQSDPAIKKLPSYFVTNADEARDFYQKFRDDGLEGAIVKPLEGFYEKKRSYGWLKMKAEESEDLRIVGWFEGEVGKKWEGGFGGYLVEREHDGKKVIVSVGSGFKDEERAELLPLAQEASKGQMPWSEKRKLMRMFSEPGRLAEIEFHEVTPDGSLRHPRFVRFRDDKDMKEREAA